MKKLVLFLFVCLFSGMVFSCTPEELEESVALENVTLMENGEDGQTPDEGEGE